LRLRRLQDGRDGPAVIGYRGLAEPERESMLNLTGLALAAALLGAAPALAQTSLTRPRPVEQDLQDLNALTVQRQQDALRGQQQSFEETQRQLERARNSAIPVLPGDPDYRGTLFR
jgi:hypothetical protein